MKQSKLMSFIEACGNTLSGFLLSLLAQALFLPFIGVPISFAQNLIFAVFMTFVSVARSFGWRRLMEALHVRRPLSPAMVAVIAERYRQIQVEGWDERHDDGHDRGDMAKAGAAYLIGPSRYLVNDCQTRGVNQRSVWVSGRMIWPWDAEGWKPQDYRRNLVRGCALGIAEIEKFDRNRRCAVRLSRGAGVVIAQGGKR